ncbi:polysaccharide biosynthesis tyrosine autokinase [Subtercola sp. RTI3]|uniref:polysaccharide biosynthesis tyrosine autokinase n=1 Tax=Subtercola sp. RTI3 TaxID=3048639 RepID=UPI002B2390C1|nr:polysaccharide biosynthesis tyrosine autokinase [Subtercola sp. RTI3]MEA9985362.1 polysaccharide biosynthesis tyrosine autokinase [Subtercola sp. RTI3]
MTIHDYVRVIRAHWIALVLLVILGACAAWGWSLVQTRVYNANSSGIVKLVSDNTIGATLASDSLAKSEATTFVGIGQSRAVAQLVITQLGLATTPEVLVQSITVTNIKDTPTLNVTARAATGTQAKELADAWITGMTKQIAIIENEALAQSSTTGTAAATPITFLVPVESAVVASEPVWPNVRLAVVIGGLIGLVLGLLYAFVRNVFDRCIRSASAVEEKFGLSVIGKLPVDRRLTDLNRILPDPDAAPIGTPTRHDYALGEAFRELRTNLRYMHVDNPPRVIVVTSPSPNDGKSTVTANLAVALAASGQKVIVVDGDLRKPSVAAAFGLVAEVGVTDLLIGSAEIDDLLQHWGTSGNLSVLGAGAIPPNPSELLGTRGMEALLRELSKDAMVLIDAPPLLPVTDAAILATIADGAIIVASAGKTTIDELELALANIAKTNGQVLGLILNRVPRGAANGRGYGYYYGSYVAESTARTTSAATAAASRSEREVEQSGTHSATHSATRSTSRSHAHSL